MRTILRLRKELAAQEDTGAGVFRALQHMDHYEEKNALEEDEEEEEKEDFPEPLW